jgi:hypothetical protein
MLPAIVCFDDALLRPLFPAGRVAAASALAQEPRRKPWLSRWSVQAAAVALVAVLVASLSVPVVKNLLSPGQVRRAIPFLWGHNTPPPPPIYPLTLSPSHPSTLPPPPPSFPTPLSLFHNRIPPRCAPVRQVMNTSWSPLKLVNTYGAFGSIGKVRTEVVLQGTADSDPAGATWLEYDFPCKPGHVARRPCTISPYHFRADWLMWFAAMGVCALPTACCARWGLRVVGDGPAERRGSRACVWRCRFAAVGRGWWPCVSCLWPPLPRYQYHFPPNASPVRPPPPTPHPSHRHRATNRTPGLCIWWTSC